MTTCFLDTMTRCATSRTLAAALLGGIGAVYDTSTSAEPPSESGYELVWQDEFDGDQLDATKWDYRLGPRRDAEWVENAVQLSGDGYLHLKTYMQDGKAYQGGIWTTGTYLQRYGYFEIRCQIPEGKGHWPAFWMQSPRIGNAIDNPAYVGTEIDIFESFWPGENRIVSSQHWGGYEPPQHPQWGNQFDVTPTADGFHVIGLEWLPDCYRVFVDGRQVFERRADISQVPQYLELTEETEYLKRIKQGKLPPDFVLEDDVFIVDWVRAYQRPIGYRGYADEKPASPATPIFHMLHVQTDGEGHALLVKDVRNLGQVIDRPASQAWELDPLTLAFDSMSPTSVHEDESLRFHAQARLTNVKGLPLFNKMWVEYAGKGPAADPDSAAPPPLRYTLGLALPVIENCWVPLPDIQIDDSGPERRFHWWLYWMSR